MGESVLWKAEISSRWRQCCSELRIAVWTLGWYRASSWSVTQHANCPYISWAIWKTWDCGLKWNASSDVFCIQLAFFWLFLYVFLYVQITTLPKKLGRVWTHSLYLYLMCRSQSNTKISSFSKTLQATSKLSEMNVRQWSGASKESITALFKCQDNTGFCR